MAKKGNLDLIALVLVIIGGLNWGLVALGFNLVDWLLGSVWILAKLVYILVGLSALWMIYVAAKK